MPVNEALDIVEELCGVIKDFDKDPFTWTLTIERHGKLQTAEFYYSAGGHFVAEDFAQRHSLIYKYHAVDTSFFESLEVIKRIELHIKIETNYRLN
jgi:hypothetical protein